MNDFVVEQQIHGYLKGHQLLSSSIKLSREDQDLVDRLSDISGQLRPRETFAPYLTCYPLLSGKYYVIARTWQDAEAPRAGCVLTRSVLVPLDHWRRLTDLEVLFEALKPVRRDDRVGSIDLASGSTLALPAVSANYLIELTEALFLENRAPTVVFDVGQSEVVTTRVLAAAWPRLRETIAVCSYALAPRKIEGRDFDLLFAPKSARMRFAGWPGRRIEATGSPARHRWSQETSRRIFESADPRLTSMDALGLLEDHAPAGDANLRLVLLWNELASKAEESPSAVLGLLDIANSQGAKGLDARDRLTPLASRAIYGVGTEPSVEEAWRFVVTLLGKFDGHIPGPIEEAATATASELAQRAPRIALGQLQADEAADRDVPHPLLVGVAKGLAKAPQVDLLGEDFAALTPLHLTEMLAASADLPGAIASLLNDESSATTASIERGLRQATPEIAERAGSHVLPAIREPGGARLLHALLSPATTERFGEIARTIADGTHLSVPALNEVLLEDASTFDRRQVLRNALAHTPHTRAEDVLARTLALDAESVKWLSESNLPPDRARRLAIVVVRDATDREIANFANSFLTIDALRTLLGPPTGEMANLLARVASLSAAPLADVLELYEQIERSLSPTARETTSRALLARAFADVAAPMSVIQQLLAVANFRGADLIRQALPNAVPINGWARNLEALNASPGAIRDSVVEQIDLLTERLARGAQDNLGQDAYRAWSDLLRDAMARAPLGHARAAAECLDFGLRHPAFPVADLVQAAFPPVYAALPRSKSPGNVTLFGLMMALPLAMFGEIDRAKSARRALATTFMQSKWPPAQLVLTGLEADVAPKLLRDVAREYRGEDYIVAIGKDARRLPAHLQHAVLDTLNRFDSSDVWSHDD